MLDSITVPSAKSLDNKRSEGNALSATILEVGPIFGGFTHLDGGCRELGGAVNDSVLNGGDNANVEGHLVPVDPGRNEDVSRTRLRTWDEAGHFGGRVKGR